MTTRDNRRAELAANLEEIEMVRDMNPPQEEEKHNQLFTYVGTLDKDGTIYVDLTRKFPVRSMDSMTIIFILYD